MLYIVYHTSLHQIDHYLDEKILSICKRRLLNVQTNSLGREATEESTVVVEEEHLR